MVRVGNDPHCKPVDFGMGADGACARAGLTPRSSPSKTEPNAVAPAVRTNVLRFTLSVNSVIVSPS